MIEIYRVHLIVAGTLLDLYLSQEEFEDLLFNQDDSKQFKTLKEVYDIVAQTEDGQKMKFLKRKYPMRLRRNAVDAIWIEQVCEVEEIK